MYQVLILFFLTM